MRVPHTTLLQGRSTSRMSVPVASAVAVSASAQCVMRVTLLGNSGERASDGAHHVGKHAAGSRFKLTGLRIGSEAATKEGGPRETPAALKTLQHAARPACSAVTIKPVHFLAGV